MTYLPTVGSTDCVSNIMNFGSNNHFLLKTLVYFNDVFRPVYLQLY
jgi:hypothetical protein